MRVAVIGAGKMGLPIGCRFADRGAEVVMCDINPGLVEKINRGESPIDEPGIPEILSRAVSGGRLKATTDTVSAVSSSTVIVVIVPALLTRDRQIDYSVLESASEQIAAGLQSGQLVIYETTVPLGGTRHLIGVLETSGLKAGKDFDVAFSPERVKSRAVLDRLTKNPKVVGGITPEAEQRAAQFYDKYLGAEVITMGSLEAAELVKLAGMIYRDVNIALANELARYAETAGLDLGRVIAAANTNGEAAILLPGIGVGGHCTPVYPYFLTDDAEKRGSPVTLASSARRINDSQPAYLLDRLERLWKPLRGVSALVLGLGFRPGVKEDSYSPAYPLGEELSRRGARVSLHDPLYSAEEISSRGFVPGSLEAVEGPELLILNTAHSGYGKLDFKALAVKGLKAVMDGRNLWDPETVREAGIFYYGVGVPCTPQPDRLGRRSY